MGKSTGKLASTEVLGRQQRRLPGRSGRGSPPAKHASDNLDEPLTAYVRQKVATIADVAAHAGVAKATVSRVVNGTARVSPQTRLRVEEAIRRLDFQPSNIARGLSRGRTMTIGVLAPFFTTPSVVERLRAAEQRFTAAGYDTVLYNVSTPEQLVEQFDNMSRGRVDGVLVISISPAERQLERMGALPVVLLDSRHPALPNVYTDDVAGGALATRHLIDLGHRRIAFVGDTIDTGLGFTSSADRETGFRHAMGEADLDVPMEYVKHGPHGRHVAHRLTSELLSLPVPPTAVFAASDTQALGVLEAAGNLGLTIRRDLSVIGYDDIEVAAYVGLTTVRQAFTLSGTRGADLLLEALSGGRPLDPISEALPLELVVRRTTAGPGDPGRRRTGRRTPRSML